jgi:ABC-type polysaccharide transport system permease subunit
MENSIKKNGTTHGLILGLILILTTTAMYAIDLSLFTSFWVGIVNFSILIAVGIYTSILNKKLLKGIMPYKDAFLSFILPIIVGLALHHLYNIVLWLIKYLMLLYIFR